MKFRKLTRRKDKKSFKWFGLRRKAHQKYELLETISIDVSAWIPKLYRAEISGYILLADGVLTVFKFYRWDGPSGPTYDTPAFLYGSLWHDALYQLIREGGLPLYLRQPADVILVAQAFLKGMSRFRARYVYRAVRVVGRGSARPLVNGGFRDEWLPDERIPNKRNLL